MSAKYVLDENGNPKLEPDLTAWANWYESADNQRIVAKDKLPGDERVSTVFLGLDHNFGEFGDPVLYETMIFGGEHDGYQQRYCTKEEALAGHAEALKLAVTTKV